MVNWVFVIILIATIFLFFKITSFRYERWWTYLIGGLLVFILFSFFKVIKNNEININSLEGFVQGARVYATWLVNLGKTTSSITGKAVLNWNVTNSSN